MNNTFKRHLISVVVTFVAMFSLVFFGTISSNSFQFTKDTLIAVTISAVVSATRAVAKIIYEFAFNRLNK